MRVAAIKNLRTAAHHRFSERSKLIETFFPVCPFRNVMYVALFASGSSLSSYVRKYYVQPQTRK